VSASRPRYLTSDDRRIVKKRIIIAISAVVVAVLAGLGACALRRDTVRVVDAPTGSPVTGAAVQPVYPSFAGTAYVTGRSGVARIGGFGVSPNAISLLVSAQGYEHQSVYFTSPVPHHVEVSLRPVSR
jgi:hypothetical protein